MPVVCAITQENNIMKWKQKENRTKYMCIVSLQFVS